MIKNQINHRHILDIEKAAKHYSDNDGVPVTYVCTTELRSDNRPWDVFYRDTPHPVFGNRYFGLRADEEERVWITNADEVENGEFGMVEWKGVYHYSRYRHDYFTVGPGLMIDGGRAYTRSAGPVKMFRVIDGELVPNVPIPETKGPNVGLL